MQSVRTLARRFPRDFRFGAATAAYQVEGAASEDGKGESIWDVFCRRPGAIADGSSGDIACDHYHRYRDDVALMSRLGLNAYRFSISWPRVLPDGRRVEQRGLDFYDRLVEALLERGIEPFATLYHWDLPEWVQEAGGWASRETLKHFAEFARFVGERLGDRVRNWMTINELEVIAFVGHAYGEHAPGLRDPALALRVAHGLLLAHRLAAHALRAVAREPRVGVVCNLAPVHAATDASEDRAAAKRVDGYLNRWYLDPLFGRGYPADMVEWYGDRLEETSVAEMRGYAGELDFLGVNYYAPRRVRAGPGKLLASEDVRVHGATYTEMGWEVYPGGLSEILARVWRDYAPPAIYVTENGAAFDDHREGDRVADPARVDYLERHLTECAGAIELGVPLRGYFVWSLLDNFEWQHGYTKRFGIVYTDYATQRRIEKSSARWYRELLASR